MNRENTEDFLHSETILYNTTVVNTCHDKFCQTHRMYNTKNEPSYKLWTLGDDDVSRQVGDQL